MVSFSPQAPENRVMITLDKHNKTAGRILCYPTQEIITFYSRNNSLFNKHYDAKEIISYNVEKNTFIIKPFCTNFNNFWESKYSKIENIEFCGYIRDRVETVEDIESILNEELPVGCFIKNWNFGLGIIQKYRSIILNIEKLLPSVNKLIISKNHKSQININVITISNNDFTNIKSMLNSVEYNINLLAKESQDSVIDDVIKKIKIGTPIKLRDDQDKQIVKNTIFNKALNTSSKKRLTPAREFLAQIEIDTFEALITQYAKLMENGKKEKDWQKLFSQYPFILHQIFGYPITIVEEQANMGGSDLSGCGNKITDFLFRNTITNNSVLLEIKTPAMQLLNKRTYRNGLFSPSTELTGTICQILEQKNMYEKNILFLKDASGINSIRTYNVQCIVLCGTIPQEEMQIKSFELYRHALNNITIITFDELYQKIKTLSDELKKCNAKI